MIGMSTGGDKQLYAVLGELGDKIFHDVTTKAMVEAAKPIRRSARAICRQKVGRRSEARLLRLHRARMERLATQPQRRNRRKYKPPTEKQATKTGQLARSIRWRVKKYTKQGVVYVAVGPGWPQGAHGHLIEYGHEPSGWYKKQNRAKRVRAISFMRPAFDAHKYEALQLSIQYHRARLERAAQQVAYHRYAGKIGMRWSDVYKAHGGKAAFFRLLK